MTDAHSARRFSPWRSIWFRPSETIEFILAENAGRRHVLFLAVTSSTLAVLAQFVFAPPLSAIISDWRVLLFVAVTGPISGVIGLYALGFFLSWIGRRLGGDASSLEMRAVIGWGAVPWIAFFAIALIVYAGQRMWEQAAGALGLTLSLLVVILFAIAALWSLIVTLRMLAQVQNFGFLRAIASFVIAYAAPAWLLPLSLRVFLLQPFNSASQSMAPTLAQGDYFFVAKYAYGYSRHSLPFSPPLFSGRIFASEPKRGDVATFRRLSDANVDYVKRIVGLPGDKIQMIGGRLYINGEVVPRIEVAAPAAYSRDDRALSARTYEETLPGGPAHLIVETKGDNGLLDDTGVYETPAGSYFVLGDNRDNSVDSRLPLDRNGVGFVPFENLIGRVFIIFFSLEQKDGTPKPVIRTDRLGLSVR